MRKDYWAKAPTENIAHEVMNQWNSYHTWFRSCGLKGIIQSLYDQYYTFTDGGFGLVKSVDGSIAKIKAQHFKSLIGRIKSLTTQAKLSYAPKAINTNTDSMLAVDLAKSLCDYYSDDPEKNMNGIIDTMVLKGLVLLDAYVYAPWNFTKGQAIRPTEMGNQKYFEGDQDFFVLNRFDVATHRVLNDSPYHIIRQFKQAYELAEEYPEHADKILASSFKSEENQYIINPLGQRFDKEYGDTDLVEVYTLLHKKTSAMPSGRISKIVGQTCIEDSEMIYETYPVLNFKAGEIMETPIGDSPGTMLLSIQQGIDALYSAVTTNNLHYSKQSVWSSSEIRTEQLSEGYTAIISAQKPEPLQLTGSSPEAYKLIDKFEALQQILSGVNATARGNPESNLKSGNSLALMLSVAVQFVDDTQKEYARCAGQLATILISNLRQFATEERLVTIGGIAKKSEMISFRGSQINGVRSVTCDIGNPITQNIAGRYELVNQWMQYGIVKDPKKLVEFLRTGQVESITEDDFKNSTLTRAENELLRKGQNPQVMVTDNHQAHILDHKTIADDPTVRSDPNIMQALTDHIMEHLDQMMKMPSDLAAVLGMQPLPSQQMQAQTLPEQDMASQEDQTGMTGENSLPNLPNVPRETPEEFAQPIQ